jgi:hypothetical protein
MNFRVSTKQLKSRDHSPNNNYKVRTTEATSPAVFKEAEENGYKNHTDKRRRLQGTKMPEKEYNKMGTHTQDLQKTLKAAQNNSIVHIPWQKLTNSN